MKIQLHPINLNILAMDKLWRMTETLWSLNYWEFHVNYPDLRSLSKWSFNSTTQWWDSVQRFQLSSGAFSKSIIPRESMQLVVCNSIVPLQWSYSHSLTPLIILSPFLWTCLFCNRDELKTHRVITWPAQGTYIQDWYIKHSLNTVSQ